ncbi:MAG: DinB family protein [Chloroflexota bacterium]|nr:MAG: DinB family protein [Chloroflexota bacterium]
MLFSIGIESGDENRSVAWVLGHPGCFAYGAGPAEALAAVGPAVRDYVRWVESNSGQPWNEAQEIQICQVDQWQCPVINEAFEIVPPGTEESYTVNAWFLDDWKPLTAEDVERGLKILAWSRQELLEITGSLDAGILAHRYTGERWSISGIIKHIGGAEWWYTDRLGLAFPREQVPDDPFERLEKVRGFMNELLPTLVGSRLVTGKSGEFWSPRKMLRRAAWHERDHAAHIRKLLETGG